jgi:AmmeMemoRadiSam system protein A
MHTQLSAADQETLLSLAYEAVCAAVRSLPHPSLEIQHLSPPLRERRASFVTLTCMGKLRGCIGTIEKCHPLAEDVVIRASAAATRDPRFSPVRYDELDKIDLEVSILSDPLPLEYKHPGEIPSLLNIGVDGVILRYGEKRATFLPQVWERVPDAEQFLRLLCRKALLPDELWKSGKLRFEIYQVDSFQR